MRRSHRMTFIAFEYPVSDPGWWYEIVDGLPDPIVRKGIIQVWDRPGMGSTSFPRRRDVRSLGRGRRLLRLSRSGGPTSRRAQRPPWLGQVVFPAQPCSAFSARSGSLRAASQAVGRGRTSAFGQSAKTQGLVVSPLPIVIGEDAFWHSRRSHRSTTRASVAIIISNRRKRAILEQRRKVSGKYRAQDRFLGGRLRRFRSLPVVRREASAALLLQHARSDAAALLVGLSRRFERHARRCR